MRLPALAVIWYCCSHYILASSSSFHRRNDAPAPNDGLPQRAPRAAQPPPPLLVRIRPSLTSRRCGRATPAPRGRRHVVITLSSSLAFRAATRPRRTARTSTRLPSAAARRSGCSRRRRVAARLRQTAPLAWPSDARDALGVGPRGSVLLVARLERSGKYRGADGTFTFRMRWAKRRGTENNDPEAASAARGAAGFVAAGVAPARRTRGHPGLRGSRPPARGRGGLGGLRGSKQRTHYLCQGVPGPRRRRLRDRRAADEQWGGLTGAAATQRRRPSASSCTCSCRTPAAARLHSPPRLRRPAPLEKLGITPPRPRRRDRSAGTHTAPCSAHSSEKP